MEAEFRTMNNGNLKNESNFTFRTWIRIRWNEFGIFSLLSLYFDGINLMIDSNLTRESRRSLITYIEWFVATKIHLKWQIPSLVFFFPLNISIFSVAINFYGKKCQTRWNKLNIFRRIFMHFCVFCDFIYLDRRRNFHNL